MQQRAVPHIAVALDRDARVRIDDDPAADLQLVLHDPGVEVSIALPRTVEAWHLVRRLITQLEAAEPEIRRRTVGYRPEYGPHTGPGGWTP